MKEYNELKKKLEKNGFILRKDGNHPIFVKNGVDVTVTKNIRHPETIFKKTVKYYEKSLQNV